MCQQHSSLVVIALVHQVRGISSWWVLVVIIRRELLIFKSLALILVKFFNWVVIMVVLSANIIVIGRIYSLIIMKYFVLNTQFTSIWIKSCCLLLRLEIATLVRSVLWIFMNNWILIFSLWTFCQIWGASVLWVMLLLITKNIPVAIFKGICWYQQPLITSVIFLNKITVSRLIHVLLHISRLENDSLLALILIWDALRLLVGKTNNLIIGGCFTRHNHSRVPILMMLINWWDGCIFPIAQFWRTISSQILKWLTHLLCWPTRVSRTISDLSGRHLLNILILIRLVNQLLLLLQIGGQTRFYQPFPQTFLVRIETLLELFESLIFFCRK